MMGKIWGGLKFVGRWLGPVLILLASWLVIFPMGPWGNGADMPAQAGAIIAAIAWFAGRKSGRVRGRQILAASALLGLAYWGWSSWQARQGFTEQAISFDNQGAHLVGTLYLPEPKEEGPRGKVPGIVFLSGSGAIPAKFFGGIATYFTRRGFAVLIYDKRGVGKSTGVREARGFTDVHRDLEPLASDAAAALALLAARPDVRADAVGFVGISEGGLISPRAAQLNGQTAFMLNITSTTDSLFQLGEFQGWPREEAKAWFGKDFDPKPSLRSLDIPGLWLGADGDSLVDNKATARDVEALGKLGKPYQYRLIPHSWHGLVIAPEKLSQNRIDTWLAEVTKPKPVSTPL
jgi:uncharacterized protein